MPEKKKPPERRAGTGTSSGGVTVSRKKKASGRAAAGAETSSLRGSRAGKKLRGTEAAKKTSRRAASGTETQSFGTGKRESHDSTRFYARNLATVATTDDTTVSDSPVLDRIFTKSAASMDELPDNSVALMVTSPPYHVGKDYDHDGTFDDYLEMLAEVMGETYRVLEPGGRAVVNVANLGRRPYLPLTWYVTSIMLGLGFLMRGEVIWRKAKADSGSCAWGTYRKADNPVLRDVHEYLLMFCKGRFGRVRSGASTIGAEEFRKATTSVWDDIPPASAKRVGHPAPFPVELPERCIRLYTYAGDLVLDPFLGSGSTAIAAMRNGRHYVGYEIDPGYVQLAEGHLKRARQRMGAGPPADEAASSRGASG